MNIRGGHLLAYTLGMLVGVGACYYAWKIRPNSPPPSPPGPAQSRTKLDFSDPATRSMLLVLQEAGGENWLGARCGGRAGSGDREYVLRTSTFFDRADRYLVHIHASYGSFMVQHRQDSRTQEAPLVALDSADIAQIEALLDKHAFFAMHPGASLNSASICDMGLTSLEACVEGRYFAARMDCSAAPPPGFAALVQELEAQLRAKAGSPSKQGPRSGSR